MSSKWVCPVCGAQMVNPIYGFPYCSECSYSENPLLTKNTTKG